jgi:hypothetical protein
MRLVARNCNMALHRKLYVVAQTLRSRPDRPQRVTGAMDGPGAVGGTLTGARTFRLYSLALARRRTSRALIRQTYGIGGAGLGSA